MSNKLFEPVKEGHDGKGRVVFICEDKNGFYVYKPVTSFKTKHWPTLEDKELQECFERQVGCTQNHGFLEKNEVPAKKENYSLAAKADTKAVVNKKAPPPPPGEGGELDEAARALAKQVINKTGEATEEKA